MAYTGDSVKVINYNDKDVQLDPMNHNSQFDEYGVGNSTEYGHLKLSNSTTSDSGESGGIAATPKAVKDAISGAGITGLTANRLIKSSSSNSITSMAAMTNNHIVVGNGSTVSTVQTKNGAFYATTNNGAASFGTLPVAQGGTGRTTTANGAWYTTTTNATSPSIGTLPVAQGGTGLTAQPSLQTNLSSTAAATILSASPRPGVTGTLGVGNGGTGNTSHTANSILTGNGANAIKTVATAKGAFYATGANSAPSFGTLPVAEGGTGNASFTANSLIISGTTTTSALTTRAITTSVSSTTGTSIPTEGAVATALSSKISVTVSGTTLVFS